MIPAAVGRAQLLQILTTLSKAEWPATAAAAGFEPLPEPRRIATRPRPDTSAISTTGTPANSSATRPEQDQPTAYSPTDLPDQPFWRVASSRPLTDDERPAGAPAWLRRAKPWDRLPLADPNQRIPRQRALAPAPRQARFLRQVLAAPAVGSGLDLARLCRQLA